MLVGGGVVSAFDERTPNTTCSLGLGGMLQASSYIGGVSGGSWLVMSNLVNDQTPIHLMKDDARYWDLNHQLLEGVPSFDPRQFQNGFPEKPPSVEDHELKRGIFDNIVKFFQFGKEEVSTDKTVNKIVPGGGLLSILRPLFTKTSDQENNLKEKISLKDVFRFYTELQIEVRPKRAAGFYLSFTDYWGRALARKIFDINARSPGVTITDCTKLKSFQNFEQPFPIIGTIEANSDRYEPSKSSKLFEFTPYEFGSWDSYLAAFVPVKYLGTSLNAGYSQNKIGNSSMSICTSGFDNIGFITGTSSSLFNHIFAHVYLRLSSQLSLTSAIATILKSFGLSTEYKNSELPQMHPDYAVISPNPFYKYNSPSSKETDSANKEHMYMVDGGDDGQNILFQSLLIRSREIDVILAYDMTADINNYPNGTTLHNSQLRYHNRNSTMELPSFLMIQVPDSVGNYSSRLQPRVVQKSVFPRAPTQKEMLSMGLNKAPIFLGCDLTADYPILDQGAKFYNHSRNSSRILIQRDLDTYFPPLIVYTANANYGYTSNTSTFQLSYNEEEVAGMLSNGYNMATNMNSSSFSVCLNCAILKRHFDRIKLGITIGSNQTHRTEIPETCLQCYLKFCWLPSIG